MTAFLMSAVEKRVLFKMVLPPFLISLIPILLVILTFLFAELNIISGENLLVKLFLEKDLISVFLGFPIFTLFMNILVFRILVKNFKSEDFSSFRIDRFGKQCDFYNFVYGKLMGTVPMHGSRFLRWWMPISGRQIIKLVWILLFAFLGVTIFLF